LRLQKQKTHEIKGKEYFGWTVVIPAGNVRRLRWKDGQELRERVKGKRLVIEKD